MSTIKEFTGEIYQRPPQRSSVKRETRIRTVYEFEDIEHYDRLLLIRVLCQAGTYIRKIVYDLGEVLGTGATMIELRRTRIIDLSENAYDFVKLHDIVDAFKMYKETGDDKKLRRLIQPIELCLHGIRAVIIRDTAVDAVCHGAQIAIPGVLALPDDLRLGRACWTVHIKRRNSRAGRSGNDEKRNRG